MADEYNLGFNITADTSGAQKNMKDLVKEAKDIATQVSDALNSSNRSRKPEVLALRKELGMTAQEAKKAVTAFEAYERQIAVVAKKEEELDKARKERRNLKRKIKDNENKLGALEPGTRQYGKKKDLYEQNIKNATASLPAAEQKVSALENSIAEMRGNLKALDPAIAEFVNKFSKADETGRTVADKAQQIQDIINATSNAEDGLVGKQAKFNSALETGKSAIEGEKSATDGLVAKQAQESDTQAKKIDGIAKEEASLKELLTTYTKYQTQLAAAQKEGQNTVDIEQKIADVSDKINQKLRFTDATNDIAGLTQRLYALRDAQKALEHAKIPDAFRTQYTQIYNDIERTKQAIKDYRQNLTAVSDGHKTLEKSGAGISPLLKLIKSGFNSLDKSTNKFKTAFNSMAHNMKSNFKHMLTNITKYVFGFRSLFFLVRRLRKYIGEGIQNMAKFNGGNNSVNANISKLITSLEYLKNAWSTAFDPILQFVTPMLTYLIDKLAGVGNAVSRFLGNLLGASKVFQAVKGPTKNYAKSLDKTGKSAGGAAKKQKQLNDRLADFDDLHVLGKDNPNSGSGGGSGSGNDDEDKKRNNKLWDFANIGNNIKEWMQKMWEDADFTQLGEKLASGLRGVFENLNNKMPEILKNANKIGKSIATFLNGLLSAPMLFTEMGKAAANLGNVLVQTLAGFFEKYKPGQIGSAIANFFRGIFQNFDWKTAGQNLGNFVSTFFTELATLFKEFPVDDFLKGLKDFFEGIDWGEVVKSLFAFLAASASLLGNLLKGLGDIISQIKAEDIVEAFKKVDWDAVGKGFGDLLAGVIAITLASAKIGLELAKAICTGIANAWIQAMKDAGVWDKFVEGVKSGDWSNAGGALIEGLVDGIGKAFGNAADWVKRYLIDPIVENFKTLFGIHSPSTVTEEWGVYLIQGLANGISNTIGLITQKWEEFKTNTATALGLVKDKIIEIWLGIEAGLKKPVNGIIGIVESCINKMISGINAIAKKLNSLPSLEFTNPFTGKDYKLGFKIPELSKVSIPRLAQGAVIPPNKEFMAMLGDQSHGTNIEAPLDTIKQAVAEVMANNGNAEVIQLLQQLIAVVQSKNLVIGDKEIGKANARYNNQQRIIRGTSF